MVLTGVRVRCPIDAIEVQAYKIPTQSPESDGTLEWDATTLVYVEVQARRTDRHRLHVRGHCHRETHRDDLAEPSSGQGCDADWRALGRYGQRYAQSRPRRHHFDGGLRGRRRIVGSQREASRRSGLRASRSRSRRASLSMAAADSRPIPKRSSANSLQAGCRTAIPRVKMKVGRDPKADIERVAAARARNRRRRRALCRCQRRVFRRNRRSRRHNVLRSNA